jgi:hypothetical protein
MIRRAIKLRTFLDRLLFEYGLEWKAENLTKKGNVKAGKLTSSESLRFNEGYEIGQALSPQGLDQ